MMKLERRSLLKILLIVSIISTAIHFTDNYFCIEQYPQPTWITAASIYQSWFILTVIGAVGYWLYKNGRFGLAYACLIIYSTTGLASPGHYFYGDLSQFLPRMHFFIWTDGFAGLAVLGFALWSALLLKEWNQVQK